MYHDLAKFNQSNSTPESYRLELEHTVESIVEFALAERAKEESKLGKKIRRFFDTIFGKKCKDDCNFCNPNYIGK